MFDSVSRTTESLLRRAYDVFNARDIDAALALLAADVEWPNGMEGGYVYGHAAVRDYWTRQWGMIDPHVEPVAFALRPDGRVEVAVAQVIRDLSGAILNERTVLHVWTLADGLVTRMDIEQPAEPA
jgi:ketosteroid isomerase-like protein